MEHEVEEVKEEILSAEEAIHEMDGAVGELPEWATIPADVKVPPGRRVWYLKFKAAWTVTPDKGDRVCVLWPISDAEENIAAERSGDKRYKLLKETSKMMIRVIDGHKARHTRDGSTGDVTLFWEDIGPKCRQQIMSLYMRSHSLDNAEMMDFLANCMHAGTAHSI